MLLALSLPCSRLPIRGELMPLSVPKHPWSHISLDCVSGLPVSSGKTVLLTVVDRLSKMVQMAVADRKRPSAPSYTMRQRVWLATKNLPLRVESCKLTPRLIGPFQIAKVIYPVCSSTSPLVYAYFMLNMLNPLSQATFALRF